MENLSAYNLEIGIEPYEVNRSNKFLYTKKMSNRIIYSDCVFTLAGQNKGENNSFKSSKHLKSYM